MSHLPLDARAILHYLNELGYRNISSTQLKEFLKDLRKLIKYEEGMGVNTHQDAYYEGLFRRTTASFRAKLDKENAEKLQAENEIFNLKKQTTTKRADNQNRRILYERNHFETSSSSYETFDNKNKTQTNPHHRNYKSKTNKADINISIIKALIEEKLSEVLREKYSPDTARDCSSKNEMTIKSIVEDILKDKLPELRDPEKVKMNTTEPGSLRSIIEDIVEQVLKHKLSQMDDNDCLKNIDKGFQQLNLNKETTKTALREPLVHYNFNRSLDSQAIVDDLLEFGNGKKKASEANKENRTQCVCCITRLQRSPRKKPEWQDPSQNDIILDKPQRPLRARSPCPSSSALSRRTKYSSSVMIRREGTHKKPNSDPVALYQYYKNEWEHFRKQIPGETSHSRLRWHIRQRLLDPE